jgi:dienelactone hydrolase
VTFHSGLATQRPAEPGAIKPKILVCTGADDPMIPFAQVQAFEEEMTKASADWQVISYSGTKHSFTNPEAARHAMPAAIEYNKLSDERSWKAMVTFFEEIFA